MTRTIGDVSAVDGTTQIVSLSRLVVHFDSTQVEDGMGSGEYKKTIVIGAS